MSDLEVEAELEQQITTAHKKCRTCPHWDDAKERVRVKELLINTIVKIEKNVTSDAYKPSLAEYLKLVALEKELDAEEIKEIKVTWVGQTPESETSK